MATLLTIEELEREILYLREQNQKILRQLSKSIEENAALRETLSTHPKYPTKGYRAFGREGEEWVSGKKRASQNVNFGG